MRMKSTLGQVLSAIREQTDQAYRQRVHGWRRALYWGARWLRPLRRRLEILRQISALLSSVGIEVARREGIARWQQARQLYTCATRHDLPPREYYLYAIHSDYERADQYISKQGWGRLLEYLIDHRGAADDGHVLDSKQKLTRLLQEHGLPTIPVLAVFDRGRVQPGKWVPGHPLPATDLFSKPDDACQGVGARRWWAQPDANYKNEEGHCVDADTLVAVLKEQSYDAAVLLQPRMRNHPLVQRLTGSTLASIRVFTMRGPNMPPQVLVGFISLPVGDETGSNSTFNVVRAPIDQTTGRLGSAYDQSTLAGVTNPLARHPHTKERIEGFRLPDWDRIVGLARAAHECLSDIALVGWDIALTPQGPLIIEGNRTPAGTTPQIVHKTPWASTAFVELYLKNLNHAVTAR